MTDGVAVARMQDVRLIANQHDPALIHGHFDFRSGNFNLTT